MLAVPQGSKEVREGRTRHLLQAALLSPSARCWGWDSPPPAWSNRSRRSDTAHLSLWEPLVGQETFPEAVPTPLPQPRTSPERTPDGISRLVWWG